MSSDTISWVEPSSTPSLSNDECHVWRTDLDWTVADLDALSRTLSAEERAKADRLHRQSDRIRSIVGRGMLRLLLSHYLNMLPADIHFALGPHGKPKLADGLVSEPLGFNLSHSGELVLMTISRSLSIGVDVEQIRTDVECQKIAARFFSTREARSLAALAPEDRIDAFYACWTRKEAYIKAREDGLSLPLDQFDVTLAPGQPARLLDTRHAPGEHLRWTLRELDVGEGYKAALAVEGPIGGLRCWEWPAVKSPWLSTGA